MTRVDISNEDFPALVAGVQARWAPIYIEPIRASSERLVIGVAVVSSDGFHIEAANALARLHCLYGPQADIVIQVAGIAIEELQLDLARRSADAILDFRPTTTGIALGDVRHAEGATLKAIGASWMRAISSLYDFELSDLSTDDADDLDAILEGRFDANAGGDRLPKMVLDYVVSEREGLARFFRPDLSGKQRRRGSHEISIDFSGSQLVANFGTLQAGQVTRSVGLIKRRLWDLKVERDAEPSSAFQRRHEMLIHMPSKDDPQITDKQFSNLQTAKLALEEQADQEQLRLEAFSSVIEIGERILAAEPPRD